MAEVNQGSSGAGSQPTSQATQTPNVTSPATEGGGSTGGQPAAAQQQPTTSYPWQSDQRFRDKGPEDVWKSYSEAEKRIGQIPQYEQFVNYVNQYAQQYGGLDRLLQYAQYGVQATQQQQRQPQQQQRDPFENWDALTPQEQAQTMYRTAMGQMQQYAETQKTAMEQAVQQQMAQQMGNMQRQWDIYQMLLTKKLENPNLPVEGTLQQMLSLAQSDPRRLMELAVNQMTMGDQIKNQAEAMAAAKIADEQQRIRNQQLGSLTSVRGAASMSQQAPLPASPEERRNAVLRKLIDSGQIGPEHI